MEVDGRLARGRTHRPERGRPRGEASGQRPAQLPRDRQDALGRASGASWQVPLLGEAQRWRVSPAWRSAPLAYTDPTRVRACLPRKRGATGNCAELQMALHRRDTRHAAGRVFPSLRYCVRRFCAFGRTKPPVSDCASDDSAPVDMIDSGYRAPFAFINLMPSPGHPDRNGGVSILLPTLQMDSAPRKHDPKIPDAQK